MTLQSVLTTLASAITLNNPRSKVHIDSSIKMYIDELIPNINNILVQAIQASETVVPHSSIAPTEHTKPQQQPQRPVNSASTPPTSKEKETAQPI
ncbi:11695_t:CDS:2, partial [Cetraspora pellucida]